MIKYQGKKWQLFVTRNMSFWHSCLDRSGWIVNSREYGIPKKHTFSITVDSGKLTSVFNSDKQNKAHNQYLRSICRSNRIFTVNKIILNKGGKLLAVSRKLYKSASEKNYLDYVADYQAMCPSLSLITAVGRFGQEILKQEISNTFPLLPQAEADEMSALLSYPDHHTPMTKCQMSLLRIGSYIQKRKISQWTNNKAVKRMVLKHQHQFAHLPVNFNEEPWNEKDIRHQIRESLLKECLKEINRLTANHRKKIRERNIVFKKTHSKKLKHIAAVMQIATEINEYRKQVFCRASLAYRPFFARLAKKYSLFSWQALYMLTPYEIHRLAFYNEKSIIKLIPKRKIIGVVSEPKKYPYYRIMEKDVVRQCIKKIKTKNKCTSSEKQIAVRGFSANAGLVTGTAKIVYTKKDFSKFKDGDILISPMTSVDFVPIIEKAAAFVTDEGGITSHASIVSRELNKPCIIGTKIATQVFKNGDQVEVDANRGIVRKIL